MTRLTVQNCWDNRWSNVSGMYFACYGTSVNPLRAKIAMTAIPGASCPSGETKKIREGEIHTFSNGFRVRVDKVHSVSQFGYADVTVFPLVSDEVVSLTSSLEILIPNRNGQLESIGVYDVALPTGYVPVEPTPYPVHIPPTPTISKTLLIKTIPTSVFTGEVFTIVGLVDVGGAPVTGEPVELKSNGDVMARTTTDNGVFSFEHVFDKAGSRKLIITSPATDRYPDSGIDIEYVSVSTVSGELAERLTTEREAYEKRRKELEKKRIVVPREYAYEPIFARVTPTGPVHVAPEPTPIPVLPEPTPVPTPTRGSIDIDIPVSSIPLFPIEMPVEIFLDGINMGKAPKIIDNVKAGEHLLKLSATGFTSHDVPITISAGTATKVSGIKLVPKITK